MSGRKQAPTVPKPSFCRGATESVSFGTENVLYCYWTRALNVLELCGVHVSVRASLARRCTV